MKKHLESKYIGVILIVMFIIGGATILGFAMSAAQDAADKEVVTNKIPKNAAEATASNRDTPDIPDFPVNESGQTYGSLAGVGPRSPYAPDLIQAMGEDGTEGYIYSSDFLQERGNNPEEELRLQAEREARGPYPIPLYASDGKTIIGEFWMFPPSLAAYCDTARSACECPSSDHPVLSVDDVRSIAIVYGDDRVLTDVVIQVGERIPLRVRIEPVGIETSEITWFTSNRDIFEVVQQDPNDTTAVRITGLSRGTATLIVKVGDVEAECIIRVRERP